MQIGNPSPPTTHLGKSMALRSIRAVAEKLARQTVGAKGAAVLGLSQEWKQIAGPTLSRLCWPAKVTKGRNGMNGTLVLFVRGAGAAELHAGRQQLIQRINAFYGFAAIAHVKMIQAPLPMQATKPEYAPPPPLPSQAIESAASKIDGVADEELKQALARLSVALEQRNKRKRK